MRLGGRMRAKSWARAKKQGGGKRRLGRAKEVG